MYKKLLSVHTEKWSRKMGIAKADISTVTMRFTRSIESETTQDRI
jgi:hypothetical protein